MDDKKASQLAKGDSRRERLHKKRPGQPLRSDFFGLILLADSAESRNKTGVGVGHAAGYSKHPQPVVHMPASESEPALQDSRGRTYLPTANCDRRLALALEISSVLRR